VKGSPPKAKRLSLGHAPTLQTDVYKLRLTAKCQSTNGKEYWKMIQDPRKNPDRHQNLLDSSLGHAPTLPKYFLKVGS